jgi:hypothetical protein
VHQQHARGARLQPACGELAFLRDRDDDALRPHNQLHQIADQPRHRRVDAWRGHEVARHELE